MKNRPRYTLLAAPRWIHTQSPFLTLVLVPLLVASTLLLGATTLLLIFDTPGIHPLEVPRWNSIILAWTRCTSSGVILASASLMYYQLTSLRIILLAMDDVYPLRTSCINRQLLRIYFPQRTSLDLDEHHQASIERSFDLNYPQSVK